MVGIFRFLWFQDIFEENMGMQKRSWDVAHCNNITIIRQLLLRRYTTDQGPHDWSGFACLQFTLSKTLHVDRDLIRFLPQDYLIKSNTLPGLDARTPSIGALLLRAFGMWDDPLLGPPPQAILDIRALQH